MTNPNILNAIREINLVKLDHESAWLDSLKLSASLAVRENDSGLINDNIVYCELTETEYEKFKATIKEEAVFHEEGEEMHLERRIVRLSEKYVNAWNEIVGILMKYGVGKVSRRWIETPIDSNVLIDKFCNYELPSDAVVGGSWDLPDAYGDIPDAPDWKFSFSGFSGFIKSVTTTDDPDTLRVEYYIYRRNSARGIGFYDFWDKGEALVDTKTYRRWKV